jgi:hypothetical protein
MMLWISSGIEHWVTESMGLRGGRGSRLVLVEVAIGGLQNSHAAMRSSPRNKLGTFRSHKKILMYYRNIYLAVK